MQNPVRDQGASSPIRGQLPRVRDSSLLASCTRALSGLSDGQAPSIRRDFKFLHCLATCERPSSLIEDCSITRFSNAGQFEAMVHAALFVRDKQLTRQTNFWLQHALVTKRIALSVSWGAPAKTRGPCQRSRSVTTSLVCMPTTAATSLASSTSDRCKQRGTAWWTLRAPKSLVAERPICQPISNRQRRMIADLYGSPNVWIFQLFKLLVACLSNPAEELLTDTRMNLVIPSDKRKAVPRQLDCFISPTLQKNR